MSNKIYISDVGEKVEIASEVVNFSSQGGGFQRSLPREEFFARFKPYTPERYVPRKATFEHFPEGVSIDAFSNDMRWNGWAMPMFELEAGKQLFPYFDGLTYDESRDAFVWTDGEGGEESEEVYAFEIVETENATLKLYPIGCGSWTWDWADEE